MNEGKRHSLTFAVLDREQGISELPPASGAEYPLPAWYRAIREIPLDELGIEDICKACRQKIHLKYVVPLVLRILQSQPLAGEMYDGEFLVSLKSIPLDYWQEHADNVTALKSICEVVRQNTSITDDVRQDVAELMTKM